MTIESELLYVRPFSFRYYAPLERVVAKAGEAFSGQQESIDCHVRCLSMGMERWFPMIVLIFP
jgi:hypothetical protein